MAQIVSFDNGEKKGADCRHKKQQHSDATNRQET
jgi:hypothetical protein